MYSPAVPAVAVVVIVIDVLCLCCCLSSSIISLSRYITEEPYILREIKISIPKHSLEKYNSSFNYMQQRLCLMFVGCYVDGYVVIIAFVMCCWQLVSVHKTVIRVALTSSI